MQLLTVNEVSKILRIRPQTVRLWTCKGKLKAYKVGGLRFKLKDIESFINGRLIKQPRPVEEILESLDKCQV